MPRFVYLNVVLLLSEDLTYKLQTIYRDGVRFGSHGYEILPFLKMKELSLLSPMSYITGAVSIPEYPKQNKIFLLTKESFLLLILAL